MALIPVTGVASNIRNPGTYVELLLGQGPSTAGGGVREALYVMPKTAAGTGVVNTLYRINNESEIETLGGPGSMAHRAIRRHFKANNGSRVYAILYSATSGGSPATATATVTYATTATARGVTRVTCNGEPVDVSIASGDTPTTVGANVAAAINAKTWLPYTAGAAAGVVTLTAKIAGASQGTASLSPHRVRAEITSGISMTVTPSSTTLGAVVAGADGTTTEAANLATALAIVANRRFYYTGISVFDATGLGNLKTHLVTKAEPVLGLRSRGMAHYMGTLANFITLATGLNYERIEITWQKNGDDDAAAVVGNKIGLFQKLEDLDTAYNFDFAGVTAATSGFWFVPSAADPADWPSFQDINDSITGGGTPIQSNGSASYIVMSCNTRSKNAGGTVNDFRATETHRVSVGDEVADTHQARHLSTYAGFKLKNDKLLANGKPDPNQDKLPKVMTPSLYKPFVGKILREFDDAAKLQEVDSSIAGLRVVRDPNNTGRLECGYDIRVIDLLHQTTIRIAEVSPG